MTWKEWIIMCIVVLLTIITPSLCLAGTSVYDSTHAVAYATSNYNVLYGTGSGKNGFVYYGDDNCTNFLSQCLIAGLSGKTTPADVLKQAQNRYFLADKYSAGNQKWYYRAASDSGSAWRGAQELYNYANANKPNWTGLHFTFVTSDTLTTALDWKAVRKGDVIFAYWGEGKWRINHCMLVTGIDSRQTGYNRIRLTYQGVPSLPDPKGRTDKGLGDINKQYNYKALFYVYRPVDFLSDK